MMKYYEIASHFVTWTPSRVIATLAVEFSTQPWCEIQHAEALLRLKASVDVEE